MEELVGRFLEKHRRQICLLIPAAFSLSRLAFIPFIVWAVCGGFNILAIFLFSVAMFTDFLDGFFARLLHSSTRWGAFLDPLCDKLVILPTFWFIVPANWRSGFFCLLILESTLVIIRVLMMFIRCNPKANIFGKMKTGSEIAVIIFLLSGAPAWILIVPLALATGSLVGQTNSLSNHVERKAA